MTRRRKHVGKETLLPYLLTLLLHLHALLLLQLRRRRRPRLLRLRLSLAHFRERSARFWLRTRRKRVAEVDAGCARRNPVPRFVGIDLGWVVGGVAAELVFIKPRKDAEVLVPGKAGGMWGLQLVPRAGTCRVPGMHAHENDRFQAILLTK
ncbi:hypothetical protein BDV95DRAFT_62681 [Massariosphaeria phaeospora]|uniref:Uncharacterized protein n=1 Tax=Massariosphaeria phaeospora TaxID=100035 RepID=A0A7C8I841_9PLEO|nr:hypothetical protein BDV95DRAFT_62681 [Massariosphaeria phaeospora]